MHHARRSLPGYALPLVLLLAGVLAAAFLVYMNRLESSAAVTGSMLKRRQAFYVADGAARAATEIASATLLEMPPPSPAVEADPVALDAFLTAQMGAVQTELDARRPSLEPDGFQIRRLAMTSLGNRSVGPLQTGPFRGMVAQIQPMQLEVEAGHTVLDTGAIAAMSSSVIRGTLSMFQFYAFIDGYAYLYTGTGARFAGRIHANGDVCMGSGSGIYAENITTAGNFFVARSSGCRDEVDYHESERSAYIATRRLTGGLAELTGPACNEPGAGCLWVRAGTAGVATPQYDRDGPGAGALLPAPTWRSTSLSRWNGQLQDASHNVKPLRVPVIGQPRVQKGRNASHAAAVNNQNSRFLVDPVLAAEPDDVRAQKLAFKADVRILNGVWYVRDPSNPAVIGRPIWSDHPGSYATRVAEDHWASASSAAVGQNDLAASVPWAARPQRFSYYQTDASLLASFTPPSSPYASRPVISYGTLFRDVVAGAPVWVPGFYDMKRCTEGATGCDGTHRWALKRATNSFELLQGTRAGFRNGWGEVSARTNDRSQTSNLNLSPNGDLAIDTGNRTRHQLFNVLPVNFDVAAFAAAMADGTAGELGSYFTGGTFNGIVWIGASWPGHLEGMADTAGFSGSPRFWPNQGRQADCRAAGANCQPFRRAATPNPPLLAQQAAERPAVPVASDVNNEPFQEALPFPLCSNSVTAAAGPLIRFAGSSGTEGHGGLTDAFLVPACDRYASTVGGGREVGTGADQLHARPNALRVINGRHIDRSVFPKGLTIATNLPAYVLGDYNSTSVPSDVPGVLSANWVPALIAADNVSVLSNAWTDANEPWNVRASTYFGSRRASATAYHFQVLAGWLESDNGNRDEVAYFTRLLEDWRGSTVRRTIRGSVVIGFQSVLGFRFDWSGESNLDDNAGDSKVYAYDYNLDVPSRQPPGAPRFQVTATRTFRRN